MCAVSSGIRGIKMRRKETNTQYIMQYKLFHISVKCYAYKNTNREILFVQQICVCWHNINIDLFNLPFAPSNLRKYIPISCRWNRTIRYGMLINRLHRPFYFIVIYETKISRYCVYITVFWLVFFKIYINFNSVTVDFR